MAIAECASVTLAPPGRGGRERQTIVWLHGEHDAANAAALSATMARAIAIDDANIVVDLSDVEFMSAATVEVILRTRTYLADHSRVLALRAPSPCARRVVTICGLDDLLLGD